MKDIIRIIFLEGNQQQATENYWVYEWFGDWHKTHILLCMVLNELNDARVRAWKQLENLILQNIKDSSRFEWL